MFCTNCGQQLDDDAVFCTQCGTRIDPEQEDANRQEQGSEQPLPPTFNLSSKIKQACKNVIQLARENKTHTGLIAGAVAFVTVLAIFLATRPTMVKLDKYISVEYSGCNTVGNARARFDTDAFCKDYAGKIKYEGGNKMFATLSDEDMCRLLLDMHVSGDLDRTSDLANGDSITYQWTCDTDKARDDFDVRLSCKDVPFSVEGLNEPESADPFADVELSYSGLAPHAEAHLKNNSNAPYKYDLNFNINPSENLKNGDTITVSLPYLDTEEGKKAYLERFGVAFTQTSKTYTVAGLSASVQTLSQVNEDILEQMKTHTSDVMKAYVAKNWDDACTLKDMTYLGSYLLTPKNHSGAGSRNSLYLVYQVNATVRIPDEEIEETVPYYFSICFENLIASADGTVSTDLGQYRLPNGQFRKQIGNHYYYFTGYETLDEAFKQCVTVNLDRYNHESNVEAN